MAAVRFWRAPAIACQERSRSPRLAGKGLRTKLSTAPTYGPAVLRLYIRAGASSSAGMSLGTGSVTRSSPSRFSNRLGRTRVRPTTWPSRSKRTRAERRLDAIPAPGDPRRCAATSRPRARRTGRSDLGSWSGRASAGGRRHDGRTQSSAETTPLLGRFRAATHLRGTGISRSRFAEQMTDSNLRQDGKRKRGVRQPADERLAYRPAELAALVGLSTKAIYRAIERGELKRSRWRMARGSWFRRPPRRSGWRPMRWRLDALRSDVGGLGRARWADPLVRPSLSSRTLLRRSRIAGR